MFITSPNLVLPGIRHGFFTCNAGVSEGIYASLNCGQGSADNPAHVEENRRRVAEALGATHLCSLYQIHSPKVITVGAPWPDNAKPQADAMVTTIPGIALGVLAADCVPVLFADAKAGVIGAAHSGWKGATGGVLEATIAAMIALGAEAGSIDAAIGPSIAQASYEVDEVRRGDILRIEETHARYFIPSRMPNHWMFDLKHLVCDRLRKAGMHTINMLENDTYMEETGFFSFRRTTHRKEPDYGRQISAIVLDEN
jgi:YfiH family protein